MTLLSLPTHPLVARQYALKRIAEGVYVREGVDEDASAGNDDAIANLTLVVGEQGAAVIDPGGSLADGLAFKAALRRVTALPLRCVVFTHAHPDHLFGAQAFAGDAAQFVAHRAYPDSLARRLDYYRRNLSGLLNHPAGEPVVPDRLVDQRDEIDLGNRRLILNAHVPAHSNSDLTVFDERTQTLICGDLLFARRIPSLDGSLKGWLEVLRGLKGQRASRAVPGHGPTSVPWPAGAGNLERYLRVLQSDTRHAVAKGIPIDAATGIVGQSERGRWTLFDAYHGHNVTRAYQEIEWE